MPEAESSDFSITLKQFLPTIPQEASLGSEVAKKLIAQKFTEIGQLVLGQLQKPIEKWEDRMEQGVWVDMAFTLIDPLGATGFKTEAAALTLGCYSARRQAWILQHPNNSAPEDFFVRIVPADGMFTTSHKSHEMPNDHIISRYNLKPLIDCGKKAGTVISSYIICSPHLGPRPDSDSPDYLRSEIRAYELVEPLADLAMIYSKDSGGRMNMLHSKDSAKGTKEYLQTRLDELTRVEVATI